MADYAQILKAGLQAGYDALQTKDANVLYFCTDTGKIYKGEVDFTNSVIVAASKPATPVVGKVYFLADTNTVEVYTGGAWKVVSYPVAATISATSDDVHVASAKAVYDYVTGAIADITGGDIMLKDVVAGDADGQLKVQKAGGAESVVTVPGVVTTPVWDAAARKLTLPVTGGQSVEVTIGKDIFLDPTAANGYNAETNTIDLYLNDGNGGEATKIAIPAASLIDIYTGENSTSAKTTVSDDNKIKVEVVVDPVAGNALVLTESGLKVDLSAYAKTADVNSQVAAVQEVAEAADTLSKSNKAALDILNGDASTQGSVDYKVAQAKSALQEADTALGNRVKTLEEANVVDKAAIQANTDNIAALAAATTTWGSF